MDVHYDGQWGNAPLIVTLAKTGEVLYAVNRSGNRPSHEGAPQWLDRSIELVRKAGFRSVRLRGDTDFSLTTHFDHCATLAAGTPQRSLMVPNDRNS